MAVAYSQHAGAVVATQTQGLTLPSNTAAGDTAVVISYALFHTISSISGLGATWARVAFNDTSIASGNPNRFEIWVGTGCTSGNTGVTVNYDSAISAPSGYLDVSTYTAANTNSGGETTTGTSATAATGAVTSTATGQAAVGGIATIANTTGATFTDSASAWTTIQSTYSASVTCTLMTAYRISGEAASQQRQSAISSQAWVGGAVLLSTSTPTSGHGPRPIIVNRAVTRAAVI